MSKCCCNYGMGYGLGFGGGFGRSSNCICDFPTLIILILIVLQFSKSNKDCSEDYDD
ncbi:MAG: hypothetical protein GX895_11575 [Clostridiales bacterium]|uniref:hypothetical protein n=1 Tax=Clostridium sp. N3C TaxID=1776758 RepID=UPI00092E0341|nr:hypothetical protein [Clostridium sp. N3C]NLZ49389.1 hypothetical protein [Clostridiales bacterium]SCN23420.1 hypothetical protein N3C_1295 [Clostridium sp. N3C]